MIFPAAIARDVHARRPFGSFARLGVALACGTTTACVGIGDAPPPAPAPGVRIAWDYQDDSPTTLLSLWPPGKGVPERLKRHLRTHQKESLLQLEVSGADPGFIWQFSKPFFAGSLRVALTSRQASGLQLFWAGARCPSFKEECSAKASVAEGAQRVTFLLPPEPLRELRLDVLEVQGHRMGISAMDLMMEGTTNAAWSPANATAVHVADGGLAVTATNGDAWITTDVPNLAADAADTFEIFFEAAKGSVGQLYWRGSECAHYDERCSVLLPAAPSGPSGVWLDLAALPTWTGRIEGLRFDPSAEPGEYSIQRIALIRTASPAR